MAALQIYDPRERAIVAAGDAALRVATGIVRPFRRRRRPRAPRRILLVRLERIGDLLMVLPAIADVRASHPDAEIDLVVGSWNHDVAAAIPSVDRVVPLDAKWLARGSGGLGMPALLRAAATWRSRRYDLAINFEPDVRSNMLVALSGARWAVGYRSAGGGPLLDDAREFDPTAHTSENARRLVSAATGAAPAPSSGPLLEPSPEQRGRADDLLAGRGTPIVAMHVAGGRAIKQWPVERFADIAGRLADRGATIVLTGSTADRPLVEIVRSRVPDDRSIDVSGSLDLMTLAAVLVRCNLLITGDTGPMHLAAAMGTPIVAVFGPSDPRRYAPRGSHDRVVRVDLPCAPCNRIRLPPARCTGHTPDCLAFITSDRVLEAAVSVLDATMHEAQSASA